jgi:hypothetical protein
MRMVARLLSNESLLSVFERKILPGKGPQMGLFWVLSPHPTRDPGIICLDDCPSTSLGLKWACCSKERLPLKHH